jgi:uncharacterized membrane protein
MDYYFLLLRIFHIGAGVFWVGSVLMLAFVINPAVLETGESGQKFMDFLVKNKRFGTESAGAGTMAGIAGLLLYWHDSQGLTSAWMQASPGVGFGIGAVLGLIGYIFGILTDRKLKAMTALRAQSGEALTEDQAAELQVLGKQQKSYLMICAGALVLSLWTMAVARFLVF